MGNVNLAQVYAALTDYHSNAYENWGVYLCWKSRLQAVSYRNGASNMSPIQLFVKGW